MRKIILVSLICLSALASKISYADDISITVTESESPPNSDGGIGTVETPPEPLVPRTQTESTISDANGGGTYSGGQLADPAK